MTETLFKILLFGIFSCVLLSLAIEDHRNNRLPNRLTIPLALTGLLLNWTDTLNQFGFHYISFQDSALGATLSYVGVRALHENPAIPLRPCRHRAGRCKISGRSGRMVWLAVATGSTGRVFADHANRIFPKTGQTVWGRAEHNRSRHSGDNLLVQFFCMKGNAPNINHIVLADLTDNNRLIELYRQAVQRRIWRDNSERDFIEFVNRAMKALHANSQEHPALLFRWLINHPSYGDIPQMCEKITFARFNSQSRQNALALARRSSVAQADTQLRGNPEAAGTQIAYLPELYAQHCPFPQNRLTCGQRSWAVRTQSKGNCNHVRVSSSAGSGGTGIRSTVWQHTATDNALLSHSCGSGQTESNDGSEASEFPQPTWDI